VSDLVCKQCGATGFRDLIAEVSDRKEKAICAKCLDPFVKALSSAISKDLEDKKSNLYKLAALYPEVFPEDFK